MPTAATSIVRARPSARSWAPAWTAAVTSPRSGIATVGATTATPAGIEPSARCSSFPGRGDAGAWTATATVRPARTTCSTRRWPRAGICVRVTGICAMTMTCVRRSSVTTIPPSTCRWYWSGCASTTAGPRPSRTTAPVVEQVAAASRAGAPRPVQQGALAARMKPHRRSRRTHRRNRRGRRPRPGPDPRGLRHRHHRPLLLHRQIPQGFSRGRRLSRWWTTRWGRPPPGDVRVAADSCCGELMRLDGDGYLYFVDRAKDMVKSGGENVYSIEVETVLLGHPAVADAAVIGVPDERWGEAVKAVVVVVPTARVTARSWTGSAGLGWPGTSDRAGTSSPTQSSARRSARWSSGSCAPPMIRRAASGCEPHPCAHRTPKGS